MNPFKKVKGSIKNWIYKLAQENQKEYGDDVPDCCKMNSQISAHQSRK